MPTPSLLRGKHAVVFGGGGSIGAAVAKEIASEGAEVFLAGRNLTSIETAAAQIEADGGRAHADVVDALDSAAVDEYFESVVQRAGGLDIAFNATGPRVSEYATGKQAIDLPVDEFMVPVNTMLKANFITASAAARHMVKQGSGVIIFLTGSPAKPHSPSTTGLGAAFGAVENLTRSMAIELGPAGVRVVCLRTSANPDSRTIRDITNGTDEAIAGLAENTLLKVSPRTTDTAKGVVFLSSDLARMVTGTVLNASAGSVAD